MNAREKLSAILVDLAAKQHKAAMTNKPTMWAYYHLMRSELGQWFDGLNDDETAGAALALIQIAGRHQDDQPQEAAKWAAMAVYARRIFREWVPGRKLDKQSGTIGSLAWLRRRADEMPNINGTGGSCRDRTVTAFGRTWSHRQFYGLVNALLTHQVNVDFASTFDGKDFTVYCCLTVPGNDDHSDNLYGAFNKTIWLALCEAVEKMEGRDA